MTDEIILDNNRTIYYIANELDKELNTYHHGCFHIYHLRSITGGIDQEVTKKGLLFDHTETTFIPRYRILDDGKDILVNLIVDRPTDAIRSVCEKYNVDELRYYRNDR